jgi:hypothetical protein
MAKYVSTALLNIGCAAMKLDVAATALEIIGNAANAVIPKPIGLPHLSVASRIL